MWKKMYKLIFSLAMMLSMFTLSDIKAEAAWPEGFNAGDWINPQEVDFTGYTDGYSHKTSNYLKMNIKQEGDYIITVSGFSDNVHTPRSATEFGDMIRLRLRLKPNHSLIFLQPLDATNYTNALNENASYGTIGRKRTLQTSIGGTILYVYDNNNETYTLIAKANGYLSAETESLYVNQNSGFITDHITSSPPHISEDGWPNIWNIETFATKYIGLDNLNKLDNTGIDGSYGWALGYNGFHDGITTYDRRTQMGPGQKLDQQEKVEALGNNSKVSSWGYSFEKYPTNTTSRWQIGQQSSFLITKVLRNDAVVGLSVYQLYCGPINKSIGVSIPNINLNGYTVSGTPKYQYWNFVISASDSRFSGGSILDSSISATQPVIGNGTINTTLSGELKGDMYAEITIVPNPYDLIINPNDGNFSGSDLPKTISNRFLFDTSQGISAISYSYLPTRVGYILEGLYTAASGGTKVYDADGSLANSDVPGYFTNGIYTRVGATTLYAQWIPASVKYTVNHYRQNIDGSYPNTLLETQTLYANTGASVTPEVKPYVGFKSPNTQTVTVAADGTTVVNYYYERNKYYLTASAGTGITGVTGGGYYYHGTSVTVNATAHENYEFEKWTSSNTGLLSGSTKQQYTFNMPIGNVTLTASGILKIYNIEYELNGGTHGASHPTSVKMGTVFTVSGPTRNGFKFLGWNITGMDNCIHTYGNKTTTASSLSYTQAAAGVCNYMNLTSVGGSKVKFTAVWRDETVPSITVSYTNKASTTTEDSSLSCNKC